VGDPDVTNSPLSQVEQWPVPTTAVAVVGPKGVLDSHGPEQPFAWASITKLLTALTVLDTVQDGLVDLDEPCGPAGSTVRHLLAHASGIGPDSDAVMSAPGRRRIYSNRGFEVLAEHVAARAGEDFATLYDSRVRGPLGLSGTRLEGSPAHGARGPIADLATLGGELLAPTLIRGELMDEATRTAFPGLTGVLPGFGRQDPNDWGLGFEIRGTKAPHWTGASNSPRTFGHFGQSGSFLWVDPEVGLACAGLGDRDFGPWASVAWPTLSEDVLAAYAGRTE
jgi:CubicO group peptidase (beta-lactamase class C family)